MSNEDKKLLFDLYLTAIKTLDSDDTALAFDWAIRRFAAFEKAYLEAVKADLLGAYEKVKEKTNETN